MRRGKEWYKPQKVKYGQDLETLTHEKSRRREGSGIRSLREMRMNGLSSTQDLAQLNSYLGDIRHAIYNWKIDGDKIASDSISSYQIAYHSVAGSCLAELLTFDGNVYIKGSVSADTFASAGSGFFTHGDIWCDTLSAVGNISGASGEFTAGINTEYLSCTGEIAVGDIGTGNVTVTGWLSASGDITGDDLTVASISSTGNLTAGDLSASGAITATGAISTSNNISCGILRAVDRVRTPKLGVGVAPGDIGIARAKIDGNLSCAGNVSANSGHFESGVRAAYLSCTGLISGDIWVPFNALKAPGTKPATYVDHGIAGVWQFADGTDDTIVFNLKFPNNMNMAVAPVLKIGWSTTATTGNAVWQLEYLYRQVGEDTTAAAQATLEITSAAATAAEGLVSDEFDTMDIPNANDICMHARLKRLGNDGDDNIGDTAELHGMCLLYDRQVV